MKASGLFREKTAFPYILRKRKRIEKRRKNMLTEKDDSVKITFVAETAAENQMKVLEKVLDQKKIV